MNTLQSSKKTSEDVSEQLVVAEQTEAKIDAAREVCGTSDMGVHGGVAYSECPLQMVHSPNQIFFLLDPFFSLL